MNQVHFQIDNMAPLSISNFPAQVFDGPSRLHELICSDHTHSTIAIDYVSATGVRTYITYASLHTLTDRLAEKIRLKIGSPSNHQIIVPVLMPQAPELYISWIAVLKAGAAFCPIAPDTPPKRLSFILNDIAASLVLCLSGSEQVSCLSTSRVDTLEVSLDDLRNEATNSVVDGRHDSFAEALIEDRLAYVMYTSGTTGQPKGVKISHKSATQAILAHEEHIPSFKRFLQFASPTFDVSVFETFFPLFRGATMVSCERERMLADLPGTLKSLDVDAAELTPTVAGTLLRTRAAAPCLRILLTIGEMLTQNVIDEFGGSEEHDSILF